MNLSSTRTRGLTVVLVAVVGLGALTLASVDRADLDAGPVTSTHADG